MKRLVTLFLLLLISVPAWGGDEPSILPAVEVEATVGDLDPVAAAIEEATGSAEPPPLLVPEEERITDEVIAADRRQIASLQERLAALNSAGVEIDTYHFAKAQAWLDFARDTYNENDRSSVVEEALAEALTLIELFEANTDPMQMSMETTIIPQSMPVRDDLWALAEAMKADAVRFPCVEPLVAQLEVQLVWSGHEERELGWRHSKPYLQAAERLARQIRLKAQECREPQSVPEPVCPECPVCPEPQEDPFAQLPDSIHFALDSAAISTDSVAVLDLVASAMIQRPHVFLELRGHTDSRGNFEYNQRLSQRRGNAARDHLVKRGVDAGRITVKAFSDSSLRTLGAQVIDHALNRRVEFVFIGIQKVEILQQRGDLQLEGGGEADGAQSQPHPAAE